MGNLLNVTKKTRDRSVTRVSSSGSPEALERQKNKVRGILSRVRGHVREAGATDLSTRAAVRQVMIAARIELPPAYRREFFSWIKRISVEGAFDFLKWSAHGLISPILATKRIEFAEELDWLTSRVEAELSQLGLWLRKAESLNRHFWNEDGAAVLAAISDIRESHGESLWLIEAEIAARQHFHGLESQKGYVSTLRKRYPAGFPAYLAYYISVRNEQRSTYFLFDEDFTERVSSLKSKPEVKEYLLYKLTGNLSLTDPSISRIMQIENANSIADIYETALDIIQRCIAEARAPSWRDSALRFLTVCKPLQDPRIDKLIFALTGKVTVEFQRAEDQAASRSEFHSNIAEEPWRAVWPIVCSPNTHSFDSSADGSLMSTVERLLVSIANRDRNFEDSRAGLAKLTRNFSFVRGAKAAGDFADFLTMRVRNTTRALAKTILNSKSPDLVESIAFADERLTSPKAYGTSSDLFPEAVGMSHGLRAYLEVLQLATDDVPKAQLQALQTSALDLTPPQRYLLNNLAIQLHLAEGESNDAISMIADAITEAPSVINAMPVVEAIGGRGWESLNSMADKLALAIALYAVWKQTDDSLRATHLRFAFEEVLIDQGVLFASELPVNKLKQDRRLTFFLENICIPVLMDTSGIFSSTDELLDERLRVLSLLARSNSGEAPVYEEEAATIRASKLIKSGLLIVDSNRVAVDTSAITRWAMKRYRESYLRYLALRQAGIGSNEKFDAIFERIKTDPGKGAESFTIPENEADALLLDIILALKERFVNDEQYGLEYFLGKRIRHGTITGHIRGPAERSRIITERAGPGSPYDANSHWMSRLSFASLECEQRTAAAFARFSDLYDQLIATARDEFLYVKSASHPKGLFELIVDAFRYHILRSMIRADIDFESFLQASLTVFWSLLDNSLQRARDFLTDDVKSDAVRLYGELQESVRANAAHDDAAMQLLNVIQSTSTDVQRELDTVSSWFIRGEAQQASHMFELENVLEVAVQSALKSLKSFNPTISSTIVGSGKTTSAVLLTVVEIVFVIFDNILRRAKVGHQPNITLEFGLSDNNDRLVIVVVNPVGGGLDRSAVNEKLDRIRRKIEDDDIVRGAFVEGESGLLKIASHARLYAGSSVVFSIGDVDFVTRVEFPVLYIEDKFSLSMPVEES